MPTRLAGRCRFFIGPNNKATCHTGKDNNFVCIYVYLYIYPFLTHAGIVLLPLLLLPGRRQQIFAVQIDQTPSKHSQLIDCAKLHMLPGPRSCLCRTCTCLAAISMQQIAYIVNEFPFAPPLLQQCFNNL